MTKSTEDREWAIRVVIDEITSSTGPTGGWLDSPKAICAAIVARLETVKRVAPCPICGKEVHGELREAEAPRRPSTDSNWSVKELIETAEKLLEWMPIYSKGSSGNIRQTNLRAAIEKFKVEHPETAKEKP